MMTPEMFLSRRNEMQSKGAAMDSIVDGFHVLAKACPLPSNLRPAVPSDIVLDAVLWYPKFADNVDYDDDLNEIPVQLWMIVEEVLSPSDEFKAFYP